MKLMKVLLVVLVMAAMVTPAIAEDRLSLSGSLQVRGQIYDVDQETPSSQSGGVPLDDSFAWNDMRMRIGGKVAVAEGVSVNFRFDTSESQENSSDPFAWGGDHRYSARRADIQFDKAYLEVEKNGFKLQAGQLYFGGFGYTQSIMDFTAPGFVASYGGFTISHAKLVDENQGNDTFKPNVLLGSAPTGGFTDDMSQTAIKYAFKGDGFSLTPMVAYNWDESDADYDLLGVGVTGSFDLGPVVLKGEVVYLDGEANAFLNTDYLAGVDLKGLNINIDGSMNVTDMIKLGVSGFYAPEQDGNNEIQVYNMSDDYFTDWAFVDYNPQHYGAYDSDFVYTDKWSIWDPSGTSSGTIAGQLYADVKATDDLGFKFAGMYFTTADDGVFGADMDGYSLDAGFSYKLAPNTSLQSHLNYMVLDNDDTDLKDEWLGIITGLTVNF